MELCVRISRSRADDANDRQRRLLRVRRHRPSGRRCAAKKKDDKFAPSYA
jgi:hypothetical protein